MSLEILSPDCTVQDIVHAMARDGACIIRDVLSPQELHALHADVTPWIEQTARGSMIGPAARPSAPVD